MYHGPIKSTTRENGEEVYRISLYYLCKFSENLKLFQSKKFTLKMGNKKGEYMQKDLNIFNNHTLVAVLEMISKECGIKQINILYYNYVISSVHKN